MKRHSWIRILITVMIAVPMYFAGQKGLFGIALFGYIVSVLGYWAIQAMTGFRDPSHWLLIIGLFALLYALLVPALSQGHSRTFGTSSQFTPSNYRPAVDAAITVRLHAWRRLRGATEAGR